MQLSLLLKATACHSCWSSRGWGGGGEGMFYNFNILHCLPRSFDLISNTFSNCRSAFKYFIISRSRQCFFNLDFGSLFWNQNGLSSGNNLTLSNLTVLGSWENKVWIWLTLRPRFLVLNLYWEDAGRLVLESWSFLSRCKFTRMLKVHLCEILWWRTTIDIYWTAICAVSM